MTKPRKLHAATIKRLSLETAEIAGWLAARTVPIAAANDFIDDGRKGTDYAAVRRGGNDSTGPERAALSNRTDDVGLMAGEFMCILERWHRDGRRLRSLGVKLAVEWDDASLDAAKAVARRSNEAAGAGRCSTCERVVSGSRIDRLRSGRCEACARYYARNKQERPRALWGTDSTDDICPNIHTHHGIDRRCVLKVGHDEPCAWDAGDRVTPHTP